MADWQGERIVLADVTVPGQTAEVGDAAPARAPGRAPRGALRRGAAPGALEPHGAGRRPHRGCGSTRRWCSPTTAWRGSARSPPTSTRRGRTWARGTGGRRRSRRRAAAGCTRSPHVTIRDLDWLDAQLAVVVVCGCAAGDARAGAGRRATALALRPRPGVGRVRRPRHHPRVPRLQRDAPLRRRLVRERSRAVQPGAGVGVPVDVAHGYTLADLALNGVFVRHPDLRIGVMELVGRVAAALPAVPRRWLSLPPTPARRIDRRSRATTEPVRPRARAAWPRSPTSGPTCSRPRAATSSWPAATIPTARAPRRPLDDYRDASKGANVPDAARRGCSPTTSTGFRLRRSTRSSGTSCSVISRSNRAGSPADEAAGTGAGPRRSRRCRPATSGR